MIGNYICHTAKKRGGGGHNENKNKYYTYHMGIAELVRAVAPQQLWNLSEKTDQLLPVSLVARILTLKTGKRSLQSRHIIKRCSDTKPAH